MIDGSHEEAFFWGGTGTLLLGGGFKYVLFSPLPGEMIQFD